MMLISDMRFQNKWNFNQPWTSPPVGKWFSFQFEMRIDPNRDLCAVARPWYDIWNFLDTRASVQKKDDQRLRWASQDRFGICTRVQCSCAETTYCGLRSFALTEFDLPGHQRVASFANLECAGTCDAITKQKPQNKNRIFVDFFWWHGRFVVWRL